jgi:hypothetical protein
VIDTLVFPALKVASLGDRVWQRGSLGLNGVPAEPQYPYAMYGDDAEVPYRSVQETAPGVAARSLRVFVYDEPGSFVQIKQIHAEIRDALLGLVGATDDEGHVLTGMVWMGNGADAYDQVRRCNVKAATYRLTARV